MTHTYAGLEVSAETYDEIAAKLRAAEYHHAFNEGVIDMHGIGLVRAEQPKEEPMNAAMPMPEYVSHKRVWALKIKSVLLDTLTFEDEQFASRVMSGEYIQKHQPKAGGYLVIYEDGYQSWSPAEAFESGYSSVPQAPQTPVPAPNIFRNKYRDLSPAEMEAVDAIKGVAGHLWEVFDRSKAIAGCDQRMLALAKTNLEQSVMWGVKGITG